jgi:DNA-binding protein H-NS
MLRQLAKNLREAQRQIEAARAERDARWQRLSKQLRGDAARLLRLLQQLVDPSRPKTRRARPAGGRARRSRKR